MIETIVSVQMPIHETLKIKKNRLMPDQLTGEEKRLCIVTGIHGDELGGQYICYEVIRRIKKEFEHLKGIIDIYPALNPLGLDSLIRGVPQFDFDMNTIFPGKKDGDMVENIAYYIVKELENADICIDIHSSNINLKEIPQVRVRDKVTKDTMRFAKEMNVNLVWIHPSNTVKEGSLTYALQKKGVTAFVIESGVALRINYEYCNQIIEGIFCLMKKAGIWTGETIAPRKPIISQDCQVQFINCESSGIFIPNVKHAQQVRKGDLIGTIAKPIMGAVMEEIRAPIDGIIFTLREYPAVQEGALIGRILGGNYGKRSSI